MTVGRGGGFFLAVDGPTGTVNATIAALVADHLAVLGHRVRLTGDATDNPSTRPTRHEGTYRGMALACLHAGNLHHHLDQWIRPAVVAGQVVVCHGYIPGSLVRHTAAGIPAETVWTMHQHPDPADLTVILTRTTDPDQMPGPDTTDHQPGSGGNPVRLGELVAWTMAGDVLRVHGWSVLMVEVGDRPPTTVAAQIVQAVAAHRPTRR